MSLYDKNETKTTAMNFEEQLVSLKIALQMNIL